ncbi:MAG TPA: PEP-CTERM sorting domain-containing protein [Gemmataceae bacterium]|nr:PEP-CTERM sorting domain-containing protein [Gemmataceae bacterium]
MIRRVVQILVTLCLLTFSTSIAQAGHIVLDFTDIPIPGGTDSAPFFTPYMAKGFSLSAVNPPSGGLSSGLEAHGPNSIFFEGAIGVSTFAPGTPPDNVITLSQINNKPFALLSIDLARLFPFDAAPTVTFTGAKEGGGTVTESFTVTTTTGVRAFQTFSFTGFTDLTSVSWGQPAPPDGANQFTNITLDTGGPVPEPASLVLVGIAVCGLAGFRLRRTKG